MCLHLLGIALAAVGASWVLHVSQGFLLLCVDRDHRLAASLVGTDSPTDVLELSVTVGMLLALDCLAVGLQAIALGSEQFTDLGATDSKTLPRKLPRQRARALASPPQRRHRITACAGVHKCLEGLKHCRVFLLDSLSTATNTPLSIHGRGIGIIEFLNPRPNGSIGYTRCFRHCSNTASSKRSRFRAGPPPPPPFVQVGSDSDILFTNPLHDLSIRHAQQHATTRHFLLYQFR
jgi:hypothetical protein